MNNDLREQEQFNKLMQKMDTAMLCKREGRKVILREMITLIRTATLDEVENGIVREQPFTPAESIKVINNLRGNDET